MRCSDFERRLNEVLDARCSPESDVLLIDHAAGCGHCAETLRLQSALWTEVTVMGDCLPADFAEQVSAFAHLSAPRNSPLHKYAWVLAVAATLLVCVIGGWRLTSNPVASIAPAPAEGEKTKGDLNGTPPRGAAGEPAEDLLSRWQDWMTSEGEPVPGAIVVRKFAGELRPIANSLSAAWHILRNTLPDVWRFDDAEEPSTKTAEHAGRVKSKRIG